MRRGRWVAYYGVLFSLFLTVQTVFAQTLTMTANVPLSSLWKNAIKANSEVLLDYSHPHILLVSQKSLGIEGIPVDKQTIQLIVFKNTQVVYDKEKKTNKKGLTDFVFVTDEAAPYTVMVINKSYVPPFIVKSATISL